VGPAVKKVYVCAPDAAIKNVSPLHTEPLETEITGKDCTVTMLMAPVCVAQPLAPTPVIVKPEVEEGETVNDPPETEYVKAPEGTITNEFPLQIDPLVTESCGRGNTETVAMAVLADTQPNWSVPTTE
jgi:hypothetical protein